MVLLLLFQGSVMTSCKKRSLPAAKPPKTKSVPKEKAPASPEQPDPAPSVPERPSPVAQQLPEKVRKVIAFAESYMGTPHRLGGLSRSGIDCSGLMFLSFQEIGITLPRSSAAMATQGKSVRPDQIRPGDLVFFTAVKGRAGITHVGLVTERKGQEVTFIHTSTSRGVRKDLLSTQYWKENFVKAQRIF